MRKSFAGAAVRTKLSGDLQQTAGVGAQFGIAITTGWPTGTNGPFVVVLGRGTVNEEKLLCSTRAGTVVTVQQRGYDGTVARQHLGVNNVTADHVLDAATIDEANLYANTGHLPLTAGSAKALTGHLHMDGNRQKEFGATGFRVQGSTQTIQPNTPTKIQYTTSVWQSNSMWSAADKATVYIVSSITAAAQKGIWMINAHVRFADGLSSQPTLKVLLLNSSNVLVSTMYQYKHPIGYTGPVELNAAFSYMIDPGFRIATEITHNASAGLVVDGAFTYLSGAFLGGVYA